MKSIFASSADRNPAKEDANSEIAELLKKPIIALQLVALEKIGANNSLSTLPEHSTVQDILSCSCNNLLLFFSEKLINEASSSLKTAKSTLVTRIKKIKHSKEECAVKQNRIEWGLMAHQHQLCHIVPSPVLTRNINMLKPNKTIHYDSCKSNERFLFKLF